VSGSGQDPHPQIGPDVEGVAVAQRIPLKGHRVGGVEQVSGADGAGEGQAAGDVVVVDMGFHHMGDVDTGRVGQVDDPVDVALRVDHQRGGAVVGEVAAVAEAGGVDRQDLDHGWSPWAVRRC
jgi:hypothetical protein